MAWAPNYLTAEQLAAYLKIDDEADGDATLLGDWVATASRAVDGFCGRQFGKVDEAETRVYETTYDRGLGQYVAYVDDLYDLTGLVMLDADAAVITAAAQLWFPLNAPLKGRVYERVAVSQPGRVSLTSDKFGWPAFPAATVVATRLQAARLAFRRDAAHGIAGSPAEGSEQRLLAALDPDLKTSLRTYVRKWWAV